MKKAILLLFIFSTLLFSSYVNIESFMKNNNTVILIIDPKTGSIINANNYAAKFYGTTLSKLKKSNIKSINVFTKEQIQEEMQSAKEENRNYFIFKHKVADGKIEKVEVYSFPIVYNNKKVLFSLINKYKDKYAIKYFNESLEEQVKNQTMQIEESNEKLINIFVVCFILLAIWVFILIYLLKQKKILAQKLQDTNINLHETNERFEYAMNATKDGLWDWDLKTKKVFFSKTWKEMIGYEEHELSDDLDVWSDRIHEDDYKEVQKDLNNHLQGITEYYENIHRMKHKSGKWIWILDRAKAIFNENNEPIRVIGFHTDITLQKEAEKRIEEQKEEFEKIFYNSNEAIAIVDLETNFLNFNDAYLNITGYSKDELLKMNCLELTVEEDKDSTQEALEVVFEKGHIENFEKGCIVKEGKSLLVSINIALLPDKQRMILTTRDITKMKNLQSQEKLVSMGEMIGNIAHQWRQPLAVITTNASGIKLQKELSVLDDETFYKSMDSIINQSKYLSETIDDFRAYIKDDKTKEDMTIVNGIEKTLSLIEATLKSNYIEVVKSFAEDIEIYGYKNELVQSFLNIINNSVDAIKQNISENELRLLIINTKKTNNGLVIEIKDNAGGIKKEIIQRVFEPYFTTKHQSVGTGIGLALTHDILTNHHNAKISVINDEFEYKNKKYIGAKFIIEFDK